MDERLASLKTGLSNVCDGIQKNQIETLMRSLQTVAKTYDADNAKSADMALDAIMAFLRDEKLEAPFRFLVDVLDKSQRVGRRTKPRNIALDEARLAATVDALMESDGISLERACREVALKDGEITWQQVKNLRENIARGKARPEATEVYRYHLRRKWSPAEEPPAPLADSNKGRRSAEAGE